MDKIKKLRKNICILHKIMVGYKTQTGWTPAWIDIKEDNESKRIRTNHPMD